MKAFVYEWRDRNQPIFTSCIVSEVVQDGRAGSLLKGGERSLSEYQKDWKEAVGPGSRQGRGSLRKPQDAEC